LLFRPRSPLDRGLGLLVTFLGAAAIVETLTVVAGDGGFELEKHQLLTSLITALLVTCLPLAAITAFRRRSVV
jgi:hypothetical protein